MDIYTNIKNYLLGNINVIDKVVSEINSLDDSLEFLKYWHNDKEFFNNFFYNNPYGALRSSFYGNYNYCDKYVKFDGYDNLSSFNKHELEDEYEYYIEDIVDSLLEHYEEMNISDKELIEIIETGNEIINEF